jgi:Cof subfamily protein (haloacid dehalogenase superfamily)
MKRWGMNMKEPKYKLVCIDLDGTLLSDDKTISMENIETIQEAVNKGVNICIATGRILKFVDYIKEILNANIKVIASNGALIFNKSGEVKLNTLSYDEVLRIKELTKGYNVDIFLNTENSIICESSISNDYSYKIVNETLKSENRVEIIENFPFEDLYDNKFNILKVVCVNNNDIAEVSKVKKLLEETGEFEISSSEYQYCEINSKGVSKGRAVEELAKELGINIKEVICIGDGGNDIEMLKRAGLSVVMENGMEHVKAMADYITDSNNNSGVAKAIKLIKM